MAERYGRPIESIPPASMTAALAPAFPPAEEEEEIAVAPPSTAARPGGPGTERIDSQVQKAQEQLLNLRRQQEAIERQKRELEELGRRQEELEQGRTELIEKFTRALVIIERQTAESQKRVEQLRATSENFGSHLHALEAINPKSWASADMQRELSRALGMVDHARTDYSQQKARLATEGGKDGAGGDAALDDADTEAGGHGFLYWLKAGVAFTLPIVVLGIFALLLFAFYLFIRPSP